MEKMLVFAALSFLFSLHIDTSAAASRRMFTRRLMLCVIVLLMVFVRPLSAAVTYVAAGAVAGNAAAITPALPAGIAANDILLLALETANQAITIPTPNGGTWTEVTNSPQGTGTTALGTRLTVFWSRYNGTQGDPTTSDSGNHQIGRIIAFHGATTSGNPWDVMTGGIEDVNDTSGAIPGTTTTVNNTLIVAIIATSLPNAANGTVNFSAWTNGNLTNVTERTDNNRNAGNGGGLGTATGDQATAGDYGSTAVTLANAALKGMISIALKPLTPPGQATNPTPTNSATDVSLTQDLSWTAGSGATSRDVYFGTAASPPQVSTSQTAATYDTGTMTVGTTYHWRVDEKNADGTTTGVAWSFTTIHIMSCSDFNTIALATITAQGSTPTGSQTATLYTSGNVSITADHTTAAQLKKIGDANQTLVTSYMLTDDGDGSTTTGGTDQVSYTGYATFLSSAYAITHVAGDNSVVITLHARAANPTGGVADAGNYRATQTLTFSWAGP